jgi:hypothetical protein
MKLDRAARLPLARLSWLLALSCPCACGGAPPAPEAPAVQARPPAAIVTPPPLDLGPVGDPPGLVVSARLANPAASLAVVRGWSGLPMPESEEVTELLMGEAVGPLADLDQPIDFALAVTGSGVQVHELSAVSIALKDAERAKASLADRYKLVPADNGVTVLQKRAAKGPHDDEADEDGDDKHRACAIAPAYGPAPVRLVCGWSPKALAELTPWLTRTATRTATSSDVHVDLRVQSLHPTISEEKRLIGTLLSAGLRPRLDLSSARELASTLAEGVVDFALDLDVASLDVLLRDPAATATATLNFSGRTSPLTRLAAAHPDRSAPAPAAFWQLPGDADFAFFERGIDDAELGRGRDLVLHVVDDALGEAGLSGGDRKPIVDALGKIASSAPMMVASGLDTDAAKKALVTEKALHDGSDAAAQEEAERASAEALVGWHVVELDEPAAKLLAAVKELATARDRPPVVAAFRSKDTLLPTLRPAPMPKGAALPAGSQHYVLETSFHPRSSAGKAKASAARKSIAIHVFIAPDGARTWIALGGTELPIASRLAAAMGPAGDKLSARAELMPLKSASVGSGGFVTARGLMRPSAVPGSSIGGVASAIDRLDEMSRLEHGGKVAVPFSLTALSDTQITTSVEVPRAAIEDVVRIIMRHGF